MSRLAKRPIAFNNKVKADYQNKTLKVEGNQGELSFSLPNDVDLNIEDGRILVLADLESHQGKASAGMVWSIVSSMIKGVTEGFSTMLELKGVGYRAQLQGQKLTLNLGFSHPIEYQLPKIVQAEVEANTKLTLKCCDKQVLGQTVAEIRGFRPPEPYKGKGILFAGEQLLRKAGKAAKKA